MAPVSATTAVKTTSKKHLIIIIAAIVAVALVAVGAGFGTYKAQLWGGKTVPAPADLGIAKSGKTHEFTAADVEKSLHKRGFKTVTKQTFSAKPKGSFLGYRNIQANKRYSASNQITLAASLGPGVPKGTSGQPVRKIQKTIDGMNVSVHYYKVIVTDKKTPADTVVASYPADGQPVTDTKTGINIGVAAQGNGVGYDIVGQDKNQAQQQYASAGFNVTLKPRFSSKARVGKIVDSNPKPGTEANGGNLTLYYGIDASGFKDAVSSKNVFAQDKSAQSFSGDDLVGAAAPVEGKYCNKSGKCIDLTNSPDTRGNEQPRLFSSEAPETPRSSNGTYDFHHQLVFCGSMQQAFCSPQTDPYALYTKDSGAFELTPYDSAFGFTCGNDLMLDGTGFCIGGKHVYLDQAGEPGVSSNNLSGARYEMGPLYAYFPVGANVQKVTDSGYFDKDEVSKSAKQKAVDTSRPFFIRRDKTLYDKTSLDFTSLQTRNPFEPFGSVGKQPMEPLKPAPSDETAYYLVEDPQLDWSSLPEYVIGGDKDAAKSDDKGKTAQPAAKDATPDQILTALAKGDFTPIAGSYCLNSGECMQLSKEGVLTGVNKQYDMIAHEGSHLSLSNGSNGSPDTTYSPNKPFFFLTGPDSEYTCDGGVGLDQCPNVLINQMKTTPTKLLYVFKGADTSAWYKENDQSIKNPGFLYVEGADDPTQAPTDRPYITIMNSHSSTMMAPPHPDGVYYLKE